MSVGAEFAQLGDPFAGDDRSDECGPEIPHGEEANGLVPPADHQIELGTHEPGNPGERDLADRNIEQDGVVGTNERQSTISDAEPAFGRCGASVATREQQSVDLDGLLLRSGG